jgi:hypothetical protein
VKRPGLRVSIACGVLLAAAGLTAIAQPPGDDPPKGPPKDGPKREQRERDGDRRPPRPPLETVLDQDDDDVISADEIKNAPTALEKLDKNKDGKLSFEEFHPRRPPPPPGDRDEPGKRPPRRRPDGDRGPRTDGDAGPKKEKSCPDGNDGPAKDQPAKEGEAEKAPPKDEK